jgi:hypothetical protein
MVKALTGALIFLHVADAFSPHHQYRLQLQQSMIVRDQFVKNCGTLMSFFYSALSGALSAFSIDDEILHGSVYLRADAAIDQGDSAALYITVRTDRPDNVPAAVLAGTRGKPPPIASARFAHPIFPFEFSLGTSDLTFEGSAEDSWWKADDLVVSARLDCDGIASTRGPNDLVGRSILRRRTYPSTPIKIELEGRGLGGKYLTMKSSK